VALFSDSASLVPVPIRPGVLPPATTVQARVADWRPGAMTIALDGRDTRTTYLIVAETWYPDWRAVVDGTEAPTYRANYAQIGVELPPGAAEVRLEFRSAASATGKAITWASVVLALAGIAVPLGRRRRA
jgi:uncharacterized membrane protein YfhO